MTYGTAHLAMNIRLHRGHLACLHPGCCQQCSRYRRHLKAWTCTFDACIIPCIAWQGRFLSQGSVAQSYCRCACMSCWSVRVDQSVQIQHPSEDAEACSTEVAAVQAAVGSAYTSWRRLKGRKAHLPATAAKVRRLAASHPRVFGLSQAASSKVVLSSAPSWVQKDRKSVV